MAQPDGTHQGGTVPKTRQAEEKEEETQRQGQKPGAGKGGTERTSATEECRATEEKSGTGTKHRTREVTKLRLGTMA